jgi:hypothetical protein
MSNGPWSHFRLFHNGWRSIVAPSISSGEHVSIAETLSLQMSKRFFQLSHLLAHPLRPKSPIAPTDIALVADLGRHIQDNHYRENVLAFGQLKKRFARLFLNVRGVDYGEFAAPSFIFENAFEAIAPGT